MFDTYLREDGSRRFDALTYAEASVLPWHRWLEVQEVAAAVEQHIHTGAIPMLRVPSPAERAAMHVERFLSLAFVGERLTGIGPPPRPGRPLVERAVDGPAIVAAGVREGRITERAAGGLVDNDAAWMLGTLVAAASLPDGAVALPDGFAEYVAALRPVVGPAEVRAARAALTAITQPSSAAMRGRADHPGPQRKFLDDVQRTLRLLSE